MGDQGERYSEGEVIAMLAEIFSSKDPRLIVGIGDDAAAVAGSKLQLLTTDLAVEGVHFRREWSSPYEIGRRVAAANIADIMAMNGQCDYLLVGAALRGDETLDWIRDLAQGIVDQAMVAGALVVGGDLSRSHTFTLSITAVGSTERVIARSGAQVGDSIYVSSMTGWSAAGLEILSRNTSISGDYVAKALNEYRAPTLDLKVDFSTATSMADVSDAISIQGLQMAVASGVRFEINCDLFATEAEFLELTELSRELNIDPFTWVLQGGEDHALLATGSKLPGIKIGEVVEGSGLVILEKGVEKKMAPVSWSHFNHD